MAVDPATAALAAKKPVVQSFMTSTLPTIGKVAGGVLGGPVGVALGGLAGTALSSVLDPASKAARQQRSKDIEALRQGKLGMSEAEKRTMLAGTQRSLQAQTAGLEANLRRQAAAQGGFGRSGAQTAALGALGAQRAEALTGYAGKVDALSQQQAQERFKDIMGRLGQRRDEARQEGTAAGQALAQLPAAIGIAKKAVTDAQTGENVDLVTQSLANSAANKQVAARNKAAAATK
jgi:hypothetical protein